MDYFRDTTYRYQYNNKLENVIGTYMGIFENTYINSPVALRHTHGVTAPYEVYCGCCYIMI